MSIINDQSIVQEKNGVKKIINPNNSGYQNCGEIFYVNRNDRTVTCVLFGCSNAAINMLEKYSNNFLSGYYSEFAIDYSYVGIAKCTPEDEFNEEFGMRLARYRANRKKEGDIKVVMRKFTKKLRNCADLLDKKAMSSPNPPVNE